MPLTLRPSTTAQSQRTEARFQAFKASHASNETKDGDDTPPCNADELQEQKFTLLGKRGREQASKKSSTGTDGPELSIPEFEGSSS